MIRVGSWDVSNVAISLTYVRLIEHQSHEEGRQESRQGREGIRHSVAVACSGESVT